MPANAGALGGGAAPIGQVGTPQDTQPFGPGSAVPGGSVPTYVPTAAPAPASSYSIANDPNYLVAQNWLNQQNSFASQDLALAGHSATGGYVSQAGVQSAQLAYQLAQQQDQAAKDQATHQLPITLLGIVNGLAAHGVGNSGDATYLPGEAKYGYDTQMQGLAMDLAAKQAQITIAQKDAAAAASANAAQASASNANELARAQLAYKENLAQNQQDFQTTVLKLYNNAVSNGTALDPATLSLLNGLTGSGG